MQRRQRIGEQANVTSYSMTKGVAPNHRNKQCASNEKVINRQLIVANHNIIIAS
jgi:hypothetical protein